MPKIVHIVLWKLKPATASAAKQAIASGLEKLPGPEKLVLGPPMIDARAKGYDYGLYSVFSSKEALQEYAVSEAHVKVVTDHVKPNIDDVLAYDFELPE